jgi:hypothetical protein
MPLTAIAFSAIFHPNGKRIRERKFHRNSEKAFVLLPTADPVPLIMRRKATAKIQQTRKEPKERRELR